MIPRYDNRQNGAPWHDQPLPDWQRKIVAEGPQKGMPYPVGACGSPLSHPSEVRVTLRGYAYCPGCKTFLAVEYLTEARLEALAKANGVDVRVNYGPPKSARRQSGSPPKTIPMFDFEPNLRKDGTAR